ncbi:MAG: sigma-70 family RNA polymerase sigma factor [Cytophagales bacterium]|nr:sigma-70 family RNA polymerase sigma factor [Armatimonadota bacterium]
MNHAATENLPLSFQEKIAEWREIRPLARTRKDNGAAYVREADVALQIQELSLAAERNRRARLTQTGDRGSPDRLREETLVYFLREYDRRGDEETAWRIAELLIDRVSGHVARKLARWRLTPDEADDCARDLFAALCEALFSREAAAEFWEVRFWVCLDRRLWNLIEKRQAVRDNEQRPGDAFLEDAGGESVSEEASVLGRLADSGPSPETLAEHQEALALLTENERLAVFLCHVEGMPEESDDPERLTAAKILGVTGRSVRNYLRRAEAKLRDWSRNDRDEQETKRIKR